MLSSIMMDPFAINYSGTLMAAIGALQTILINCWPRLVTTPWQEEITKMLVVCWLNVKEDLKGTPEMEAALIKATQMLLAVMKAGNVDLSEKISPLIEAEPQLSPLFGKTFG